MKLRLICNGIKYVMHYRSHVFRLAMISIAVQIEKIDAHLDVPAVVGGFVMSNIYGVRYR